MEKHCKPCEGGVKPLEKDQIKKMFSELSDWQLTEDNKIIFKDFKFKNFYETMKFVNSAAAIANEENHHPDLEVGYNHCLVKYTTHAIGGLSENDFICAAQIDALAKINSQA